MRHLRYLSTAFLLTVFVIRGGLAQQPSDNFAAERVAADYVSSQFAKGRILFDTSDVAVTGPSATGHRTSSENNDLAQRLGAKQVGRAVDFRSCPTPHSAQCDIVGFDSAISMSRAAINGTSATLTVRRFFHTQPGRSAMSVFNYKVHLSKISGAWVVDKFTTTSIS